ncbi:DNA-binding transcriptional regulator [Alicyclobacillaceae bacterium I2511]|nr:DNA-binding transcriptional regulator [Alicyclobacillaceae bacterium I2511]
MESVHLGVARRIVPELLDSLRARARVLQRIRLLQPIGRRALAVEMGLTERVLRAEVDFLREQGLVMAAAAGMSLSDEGNALLEEIEPLLASIEGRAELANALARVLAISTVIVVSGDSDREEWVKDTLGLAAARYLRSNLQDTDILAVTGGSTMAAVARMMTDKGMPLPIEVVPARGGLGEEVALQANTIAEHLALQLGGRSIMLHVPDRLTEGTLQQLMHEPLVEQSLAEVRRATVVVHGLGDAIQMAFRRRLSNSEVEMLNQRRAIAEAFGYYFNPEGETVYNMTVLGLSLADLAGLRLVVAVAGGASKAPAIAACSRAYRVDVLVTDEGAAKALLSGTEAQLETSATQALFPAQV